MIRIAVVEDQNDDASALIGYLDEYSSRENEPFKITRFTDGEDLVSEYRAEYDIILMDVEMASMDGMTAAERIRACDGEVIIIFITNMAQYAIEGYRVDALDYVLKPVSYFQFAQRLARAIRRMRHREEKFLLINARTGAARIRVADLMWVESRGHRLSYHTTDGVFESTTNSMKQLEEKLGPEHFFRCNKGFLVNLARVRGVADGHALVGEGRGPVSEAKRRDFMMAMARYAGEAIA